jgi:hypothetical protein
MMLVLNGHVIYLFYAVVGYGQIMLVGMEGGSE